VETTALTIQASPSWRTYQQRQNAADQQGACGDDGNGNAGHGGILAAGFHRLIENRVDHHRKRDDLGRHVFHHPLEIAIAGFGMGNLHSGDAGLQDAFEPGNLQIEVRHLRTAHQSAHRLLPQGVFPHSRGTLRQGN
jgi:hypothetical protein